MDYSITPFSYSDEAYEQVLALRNRLQPDEPSSVEIWRYWDEARSAETPFLRLVASDAAGRLAGYGQIEAGSPTGQKFALTINLLPTAWETDLSRFIEAELRHPNFLPEGYFLALDGERLVGMSMPIAGPLRIASSLKCLFSDTICSNG